MSLFPLRILDRTTIRLTVAIHGYRALLRNLPAGCRLPRATLEEAVESDGTCLALLRPAERTPGLCRRAVRENGAALRWVPRQLVDADLCRLAVLSNPLAIRAVPPHLLAPELVDLARRRGCPVPLLPFAGEQAPLAPRPAASGSPAAAPRAARGGRRMPLPFFPPRGQPFPMGGMAEAMMP